MNQKKALDNHGRILRYVQRYFTSSHNLTWPTVREVSRALRLKQSVVMDEAEGAPLMLTSWHVLPPDPNGEHFVEICE